MVTNDNNDDDDGNRYDDDDDFKLHHLQMGPNQWCLDLRDGRKQEYPTLVTPGTNLLISIIFTLRPGQHANTMLG